MSQFWVINVTNVVLLISYHFTCALILFIMRYRNVYLFTEFCWAQRQLIFKQKVFWDLSYNLYRYNIWQSWFRYPIMFITYILYLTLLYLIYQNSKRCVETINTLFSTSKFFLHIWESLSLIRKQKKIQNYYNSIAS